MDFQGASGSNFTFGGISDGFMETEFPKWEN